MSAVRSGERLLQIGVDDPVHVGSIAAKVGLGGDAVLALPDSADAVRLQVAVRREGLVDTHVGPLSSLPGNDSSFDVVVVHGVGGLLTRLTRDDQSSVLRECLRVLRSGGRLVVFEAGLKKSSFKALISRRHRDPAVEKIGAVLELEIAGFRPVRVLGERDGYRFIEGIRP
jgi:SAM-dependent methyltransferase